MTNHDDQPERADDTPGAVTYVVESLVGLVIAILLLWVAIAAVTEVPFVYQGL